MRSLWHGTVSFGLVALPVDIYTATEDHGPGLISCMRSMAAASAIGGCASWMAVRSGRRRPPAAGRRPTAARWSSGTRISKLCRYPRSVCKVALRSRERLSVLRPRNGILVLHTLHWPEEIRDPGDLSSPAPTTDRELNLAELLMTEMAGVDITELHDDYAQALNLLVDTLAAGGKAAPPREPQPPMDLMAALEESVRDAQRARNGGHM